MDAWTFELMTRVPMNSFRGGTATMDESLLEEEVELELPRRAGVMGGEG